MKMKVSRTISGRQWHHMLTGFAELAGFDVEFPNQNLVQSQVHVQHKLSRRIGLNHMSMRAVMSAESKAAWRSIRRRCGPQLSGILLNVGGFAQLTVVQNWQHRHRSTKVVGDQQKPAGWMNTDIGGARSARRNGVQHLQLSIAAVDGKRSDCAVLRFSDAVRFI